MMVIKRQFSREDFIIVEFRAPRLIKVSSVSSSMMITLITLWRYCWSTSIGDIST